MALRSQEEEEEFQKTNGRNGAGVYYGEKIEDNGANGDLGLGAGAGDHARRTLAVLAISGSLSDAETLFMAMPGNTRDEWDQFLRVIVPVRKYVVDGDSPYVRPVAMPAEYEPVITPQGDCAEDALPLEARNPYRAAAKAQMSENRKN